MKREHCRKALGKANKAVEVQSQQSILPMCFECSAVYAAVQQCITRGACTSSRQCTTRGACTSSRQCITRGACTSSRQCITRGACTSSRHFWHCREAQSKQLNGCPCLTKLNGCPCLTEPAQSKQLNGCPCLTKQHWLRFWACSGQRVHTHSSYA